MGDFPLLSHICGENVRVSEGRSDASWDQRYSGGIIFSDQPLRLSDSRLRLELNGSSHVDICVTQTDPNALRGPELVRQLYLSNKCDVINNIRVHKKTCEVFVQNLGDKVVSPSGDQTFGVSIDSKQDVWLVICIKFGNASVTIDSPAMFHDVTGENIEFEGTDKRTARLKVLNPAAICVIDREVMTTNTNPLTIRINPVLSNDGNPPHIYHVKLGVTTVRPEDFSTLDPQSLSISKTPTRRSQSRWSPIQTFERRTSRTGDVSNVIANCKGELTIAANSDGELEYSHTSGAKGKWPMKGSSLFIVLELFRVSVEVLKPLHRKNSEYATNQKGRNACSLTIPTAAPSTSRGRASPTEQCENSDDSYISPVTKVMPHPHPMRSFRSEPSHPVPLRSEPSESSWHDWPTSTYTSWVLQRLSSLEADATAQPPQTFERKMTDTITEMKKITLQEAPSPPISTGNRESIVIRQPINVTQNSATLPSCSTTSTADDTLSQIDSKMDHLEKTISELKNVEKVHHDKMYASYKALKEVVVGITKPTPVPNMVSMATTIRGNYTALLKELETRDLIFRLYEKGIIHLPEKQMLVDMRAKGCGKEDLNDKLLDYLGSRPVSRDSIIEALHYSKQAHLKDKMLPSEPQ